MLLCGVAVSTDQIASAGFRAVVGQEVTLGLSLDCRLLSGTVAVPSGDLEVEIAGLVIPAVRDSFYGGWVLSAGDVPFHGTAESRELEAAFLAETGGRETRVRGTISVADDYIVDEVRQGWDIDLERAWLVRRIVRLTAAGEQPADEIELVWAGRGYLLDLERPSS